MATTEQAQEVEAGRELDALVQAHVMKLPVLYQAGNVSGFVNDNGTHPSAWVGKPTLFAECLKFCAKWNSEDPHILLSPLPKGNPPYSTDIAAAFEVLNKVACDYHIEASAHTKDDPFRVTVMWLPHKFSSVHKSTEGDADTLPLAICKAALRACEGVK